MTRLWPALFFLASFAFAQPPSKIEMRMGNRVITNETARPGAIRVLFIGNSLTYWNEMPWMLEQMSRSPQSGKELDTAFVGGSGMSLRQHWDRGEALRAIREQRWDYVVLQGQSSEWASKPDELANYARLFDGEIRARGAKTVLFLSWPREGKEQKPVTTTYARVGRELGAIVAPVGVAWEKVLSKDHHLYDGSGLHPNLEGSYLSACVFYAVLTGKSPRGLPHRFDVKFEIPEVYRVDLENERIEPSTADWLQRIAWQTVNGGAYLPIITRN